MKSMSGIRGVLAAAALAFIATAATGCAGTKAAYDAADTLEERAFVATEHYTAVVEQAAALKNQGVLKGQALAQVRELELVARPIVLSLGDLVKQYNAARDAETEVELQRALDDVVQVIGQLVRAVRGAAGGVS